MTGSRIAAICLITMTAACAGSQNRPTLDQRVTRIGEAKDDTTAPSPAPAPAAPKVDASAPGPDWFLQRDVSVDPDIPPAAILLANPTDDVMATVFIVIFPNAGAPKEMAAEQRKVFVRENITCSKIAVSKDGTSASFTTVVKRDNGKPRAGKVTFMTRPGRTDAVITLFGSWESKSNKASLADMAKIEASIVWK